MRLHFFLCALFLMLQASCDHKAPPQPAITPSTTQEAEPTPTPSTPQSCNSNLVDSCGANSRCMQGVQGPDWQQGYCITHQRAKAIYQMPLHHPEKGAHITHTSAEGSHGYVSDYFAMDIKTYAQLPGEVIAAREGRVVLVMEGCKDHHVDQVDDPCGEGYGNHVRIEHEDGDSTFYAHFGAVYVQHGQQVERGQPLGQEGASGRAGTRHLHFVVQRRPEDQPFGPWQSIDFQIKAKSAKGVHTVWSSELSCTWQQPCAPWHVSN